MKELTDKFRPFIRILIIPYLFFIFILVYPINFYLFSPGGIVEVKNLITVDYNQDKEVTGTISSTYIMDLTRPSFFEFMIGYFSPYSTISVLSGTNLDYSNSEINQISYLDKATSVDAAILVAYEKASETNPDDVSVTYVMKTLVYGKAQYLSYYDDINFGDEFVSVAADDNHTVTTLDDIST